MKISIEIELKDNELDLATELLNTLRELTDHVQVKHATGRVQPDANAAAASSVLAGIPRGVSKASLPLNSAPPFSEQSNKTAHHADVTKSTEVPATNLQRPVTPPPGMPLPGNPPLPIPGIAKMPSSAASTSSSRPTTPQTAISQAPMPPQPAVAYSEAPPQPDAAFINSQQPQQPQLSREMVIGALKKLMMQLDCSQEDYTEKFQSVSTNLNKILEQSSLGTRQQAFDQFFEAFISIIFDSDMVANGKSVVPYMNLLPMLPEPYKSDVRGPLIAKVLKHLTITRPVNGNRAEFFAQAEAFACLVSLEFVGVLGAVQTLCALLKDEKKRCAAVTMLGKTSEHCAEQLKRDCPTQWLDSLRKEMEALESDFDYDKDYINDCMGWKPAAAPATAQNSSATATFNGHTGRKRLVPTTSFVGHSTGIFALAWDAINQQMASSCKDGDLILWDPQGRQLQRLAASPGYAYNGMACAAEQGHLAAVGLQHGAPPCVDVYHAGPGSLELRAHLTRSPASLLSSVTALPGTSEFATGERLGESGVVSLYDSNSLPRSGEAQPVRTLKGDQDLVTVVAPLGSVPVLLSGAKDGTIAVWDVRQSKVAITLVGKTRASPADNTSMVTTIDSQDTTVLAGCLDTHISKWDLRSASQGTNTPMASVSVDDNAVLRIVMGSTPGWAAISTIKGLYYMDPFDPSLKPDEMCAGAFSGKKVQHYADLKWGVGEQVLYAAGSEDRIDVYTIC